MITVIPGKYTNDYYGLSTDTKPTDANVPNASPFYEMNKRRIWMYDAENVKWWPQFDDTESSGG